MLPLFLLVYFYLALNHRFEQNTQSTVSQFYDHQSYQNNHKLSWAINFSVGFSNTHPLLLLRSQHRQTRRVVSHRGSIIWQWPSLCAAGFGLTSLWCHHHNYCHRDCQWKCLPLLSQVCLCWLLQTYTSGSSHEYEPQQERGASVVRT